jgi:AraC-like DNA-binding protein
MRASGRGHDVTAAWDVANPGRPSRLPGVTGRRPGSFPDPEVAWVWRRLVAGRGLVRIDQLAAEVGWSRKRLWSRFAAQLGLPPKRAASLIRFDHAAYHLAVGRDPAGVAADAGYADQSHLHREVVACTGVTPARLAEEPFLAVDDVAWPALQRHRRAPASLGPTGKLTASPPQAGEVSAGGGAHRRGPR